jgi:hypothetical protein
MKRKKKGLGSAKQRGPLKLTITNYHEPVRCVNNKDTDDGVIACQGFTDLDPLRINVHLALKTRPKGRRKEPDPEQLVWIEVDEWLTKLNEKGPA